MNHIQRPDPVLIPPPPRDTAILDDAGELCPGVTGEFCGNPLKPGEEFCFQCGWELMKGGV
ncbi:MAG: hypothetical protein C4519_00465 [Desulfobacteraceae bacterium]|nr:MAG: hypothetical protein C4519_00465 [Desulfobacteraceae bacterium]